MNWPYRLSSIAKVLGASYQIIMAGLTIFYTIRMSINWDKPDYSQHQYYRRLSNDNKTQPKIRPFKSSRRYRR
jgi:hypothetical protein